MDTDKALILVYVLYTYTHVSVCVCVYIDACVFRHIYVYMLEIAYMYPARTGSEGKPAQADQPDRPDTTRSVDIRYACCNLHNTLWLIASQRKPSSGCRLGIHTRIAGTAARPRSECQRV